MSGLAGRLPVGVYDAVTFDVDDEEATHASKNKRSPNNKPLPIPPKKKTPLSPTLSLPQHRTTMNGDEEIEEDTSSLDSYEEMNEVPGLPEKREWEMERQSWNNPRIQEEPVAPFLSPMREESPPPLPPIRNFPDPATRPKVH